MPDTAPPEDAASTDAPRTRHRARLVVAGSVALVLLLTAGISTWFLVIRPRQLVEVHDDTGRISVRVPRAWTKEVEGRAPKQWAAYLYLGTWEDSPLKVAVYNGPGTVDAGEQCGKAAEPLDGNTPAARTRIWAYPDCPEGQVSMLMQKTFESGATGIVQVRADDERTAQQVLDSVQVDWVGGRPTGR
ncbi:hypothetical protein EV137_6010 [Kribbella pratensis]|uniref:DUF4245 domain-containing protein n=1 Tax=Kribbella pratensis TaxID=2512112 RepID=A0ABY2FCG8_9ACTN|nr:hypothetical protein [Kribbella pratensis]TDW87926.1 hypothetical protein EV137_6010 [Kribbella pratensis]